MYGIVSRGVKRAIRHVALLPVRADSRVLLASSRCLSSQSWSEAGEDSDGREDGGDHSDGVDGDGSHMESRGANDSIPHLQPALQPAYPRPKLKEEEELNKSGGEGLIY